MSRYRILSMDGGPHGVNYLRCLRKIEERNPGFLASVDMFAGSTFGSMCATYFARHVASLKPGESAVDIIDGCIRYTDEAVEFIPDVDAFSRLLGGRRCMYTNDEMNAVLTHDDNLGTTRLRDLGRRMVAVSASAQPPWMPHLYDSAADRDADVQASEIPLESCALPGLLPMRNGRIDGALAAINPCMYAITSAVSGPSARALDDVVVLTLGGDGGTTKLSNILTPWSANPMAWERPALPTAAGDEIAKLDQRLEDIEQRVRAEVRRLADPETLAKIGLNIRLDQAFQLSQAQLEETDERNHSWGKGRWFAFPTSPLFAYQLQVNNLGGAAVQQARALLGKRAMRLAPISMLDSNVVLLFFFFLARHDLIRDNAQLTADLWSNPTVAEVLGFTPSFAEVQAFIDTQWNGSGKKTGSGNKK